MDCPHLKTFKTQADSNTTRTSVVSQERRLNLTGIVSIAFAHVTPSSTVPSIRKAGANTNLPSKNIDSENQGCHVKMNLYLLPIDYISSLMSSNIPSRTDIRNI